MRRFCIALGIVSATSLPFAQSASGPYKVIRTAKVGGVGGFDYVFADAAERKLYIPRSGAGARVTVFNLDTLAPVGEITNTNARGVAVDPISGHGFASSKPVAMWDSLTLAPIKTIDIQGNPDGIMFDPFNERIWVFSHVAPHATIIDGKDGTVVGTLDLGGEPEQAVSDGNGRLFVDIEDKDQIAVVDTKALRVTTRYDLSAQARTPAGLAFDVKNHVLFAACRAPGMIVMLNSDTGKIISALPIGSGVDGAVFNPATMEAFSSQGDGTLTVIKENSPTAFAVEQTVRTQASAKTLTLDKSTNRILVIAAEFGPPPAPAPAGGRGRGQMLADSFAILMIGR
jgi:hypothetical protein